MAQLKAVKSSKYSEEDKNRNSLLTQLGDYLFLYTYICAYQSMGLNLRVQNPNLPRYLLNFHVSFVNRVSCSILYRFSVLV